jgi:excisionase family DNA binding protein
MDAVMTSPELEMAPAADAPRATVSLDDAARRLGVSRRTIYNRIREGMLVTVRTLNGSQRVLLDSITNLQAQAVARNTDSDIR